MTLRSSCIITLSTTTTTTTTQQDGSYLHVVEVISKQRKVKHRIPWLKHDLVEIIF